MFFTYSIGNINKMIDMLENAPNKKDASYYLCRKAICGVYKNRCDDCMFRPLNNSHKRGCGYIIGDFEEDSIATIIENLKKILYQVEYRKFKR